MEYPAISMKRLIRFRLAHSMSQWMARLFVLIPHLSRQLENGYGLMNPLRLPSPPWDGPNCFTIQKSNTISFSGYLYYLDPVPPDTNQRPMRGIVVEMMDNDPWPLPDNLLDVDITDEQGHFYLGPIENSETAGNLDIYFNIYAKNEATYITTSYNGDLYTITTPVLNNLLSGEYDTSIVATLSDSKSFFYFGYHTGRKKKLV